uniref:Uncharacterized protein n=1 Tax=Panagrolaimus superbus TaxID=310955 RepID=A0A914Z3Q6_9BILA
MDPNESVIELVTKPNLKLNICNESKFEAVAKSWESFSKECNEKFDYILTSETIYDAGDYASLHDSMNAALKEDGTIILAAKMVYFGKTGDYFRFLDFIDSQSIFEVIESKQIEASVQRIIAHLKRK